MRGNSFHEESACEFSSHEQSIFCNSTHWASSPGCQLLLLPASLVLWTFTLLLESFTARSCHLLPCKLLQKCFEPTLKDECWVCWREPKKRAWVKGANEKRSLLMRWVWFGLLPPWRLTPGFSPGAVFSHYFPKFRAAVSKLKGGLNKGLSSSKKGSNSAHMKI